MSTALDEWRDWPSLIAGVRSWPVMRQLLPEAHEKDVHLLLQAPVALAWWLATFAPRLLARPHLDIVVVAVPGGPSSTDEGRPYQLLPALLGRPHLHVNVTVLFGSDDPLIVRPMSPAPRATLAGVETLYPALRSAATLEEWWGLCQGRAPDACVLMQPRFDTRIAFWKGLRLYHDVNVPVGCFARSVAEAERDKWMLEAYGYSVSPTFQPNPWAQRWPESRGHGAWAAVGWHFNPRRVPGPGHPVDVARLHRAAEAQTYLQHEFEVWNPLEYIGRTFVPTSYCGEDAVPLLGLPDHHALSLRTGEVWQMEIDGPVPVFGNTLVPAQVLETYPGDDAPAFERLLWAVDVYRREFRPREAAALEALGMERAAALREGFARAMQGRASDAELQAFENYYAGGEAPGAATPGSETFFAALREQDWQRASELASADPHLANAVDEEGKTGLFHALAARHLDLARCLLDLGAHPDHLDHEGFAVVHDVAKRDDVGALELLERYGANLDLPTGIGLTPAVLALRYRAWGVLGHLLARGVDLGKGTLPGASLAEQYEEVDDLPRVLRAEIDKRLGKKAVIPIAAMGAERGPSPGGAAAAGTASRPPA